MAEEEKKNKGFWKSLFSKEEALEEALSYSNLTFFKKSKNNLVTFILVVSVLSLALSAYGNIEALQLENILFRVVLYIVLLPFIYLNHRWAIIIVCLIYSADKIFFIVSGVGTPISHIILLILVLSLSYKSLVVAHSLKKQKLENKSVTP